MDYVIPILNIKTITIENDSINPDDSLSISLTVYNSPGHEKV